MAPSKGNTGNKNPHMTKRNRFNSNSNVPVSHAGCQVSAQAKLDKQRHQDQKTPVITRVSKAKGIFHVGA